MRGAQAGSRVAGRLRGIIPADAGSTYMQNLIQYMDKDHPRGCGEHVV